MLNQLWRDPSFIAFKELFFTVRFPFVLALLLYTSIPYQLLLSQLWQHRSLLLDFWPYHDLKCQTLKQKQINLPFLMKNNVLDHGKILRMTKDSIFFREDMKLQFLSKWNYCSLYFHSKTCGNTKNIIGKVQIILITFRRKNILLFVSFLNENTSFIDTLTLAKTIWLWKNKTKLSNLSIICYNGVLASSVDAVIVLK